MSHSNKVTWQCDRCPRTVQMPDGQTPKGWGCVKSQAFDKEGQFEEWELCDGCLSQHGRFMLGQKASVDE